MKEADGYYKIWVDPMSLAKYKVYGPDGEYIRSADTLWGAKRLIKKHRRSEAPHEVYRELA